jgi:hypothetical protein
MRLLRNTPPQLADELRELIAQDKSTLLGTLAIICGAIGGIVALRQNDLGLMALSAGVIAAGLIPLSKSKPRK